MRFVVADGMAMTVVAKRARTAKRMKDNIFVWGVMLKSVGIRKNVGVGLKLSG